MTTPPPLTEGMVIANRFRLDRLLGQGGMGSVWAAWHITLNVEVAVKFIEEQLGLTQDAWSRFSQEAMAAAKIKSPHVVNILDFGTDEHRRPYIAMEILQGEELASRLDREGTLSLVETARLMAQACKGLARAHAAGIVHRDIKPDNLYLTEDEDGFLLKILDFGIAKVAHVGSVTHKTGTGQVLGTPLFMSPEQAYGNRAIDHRSDLYSLAVVAYRALAGQVPFNSDGVGELIVAITTREPPLLSSLRPGLPHALDAWFQRALSKDPEARFKSAREMNDAFQQAAGLVASAESTAQFAALSFDELSTVFQRAPGGVLRQAVPSGAASGSISGSISGPVSAPIIDPFAPPLAPETLQGAMISFDEIGVMPPSRKRWLAFGGLAVLAAAAVGLSLVYSSQFDFTRSFTSHENAAATASTTALATMEPIASATPTTSALPADSSTTRPKTSVPKVKTTKTATPTKPGSAPRAH